MYSKVKENVQGHFDFHFLCCTFNYFSNKRYSVFAECTANIYIGVQLEYKFVVQYSLDLQYYCILKKCSVHGSK